MAEDGVGKCWWGCIKINELTLALIYIIYIYYNADYIIRICIVIYVADFLQRVFYVSKEYLLHSKYYSPEDRLATIIKRAYTYNNKTVYLALLVVFTGLTRFGSTHNLARLLPRGETLFLIPLYWILTYVQLSHSSLSYAYWIRDSHGLDYAAGMASNYFHGYLKLSLPERDNDGLQKRMQQYEDTHQVKFGMNCLLILIPDEMFVNRVIRSKWLEEAEVSGLFIWSFYWFLIWKIWSVAPANTIYQ